MTAKDTPTTSVAAALREALATANREGAPSVSAGHLAGEQFEALSAATLAHLRSRPGKPSAIEGWSRVTARDAAVVTWWAEVAGLTESERRRLGSLRREVLDVLAAQHLIETDSGRSTPIQVSPAVMTTEPDVTESETKPVHTAEAADPEPSGAWVLKLSPYLYDADRVFAAPDRRVRVWSIEDHERSARMRYGDPVYLWVGDGDPYRLAGVWGVGYVAGPTILGIADDGWLDCEAASRASVFAVVNITLLERPVGLQSFLDDARLIDAEVIRDPFAPNPGVFTASEAAALSEVLRRSTRSPSRHESPRSAAWSAAG